MNRTHESQIETICTFIYNTYNLSTCRVNEHGNIIFEYPEILFYHPLHSTKEELMNTLYSPLESGDFPIIKSINQLETFFIIQLTENEKADGALIIGPSIHKQLSERRIKSVVNDIDYNPKDRTEMIQYFTALPYIEYTRFMHITAFIYYLINKKQLTVDTIIQKNNLFALKDTVLDNVHVNLAKRRENATFHHDPLFEIEFFQRVKEGNIAQIRDHSTLNPSEGEFGLLSKDSYVRNKKNIAIIAITLATRAAIEGGLNPEVSYTLSDLYIQRLEKLNYIEAIDSLLEEAVYDFTERVHQINHKNYSKEVIHTKKYIFNHLYERITLEDIGKVVNVNANYLSSLFKKETGISISQYILSEKVNEAKRLIVFSNHTLSEIGETLHFYDQSYFSKVFKTYAGMTPNEYKHSHGFNV